MAKNSNKIKYEKLQKLLYYIYIYLYNKINKYIYIIIDGKGICEI